MAQPKINQGTDNQTEETPKPLTTNPADFMRVAEIAVMKGPEEAAKSNVPESEAIMHQMALGVHAANEMVKPKARQVVNSFFDTTLGTIVEVTALGLGAFAGGYVLTGIVRTGLHNRAERKTAEAEALEAAQLVD